MVVDNRCPDHMSSYGGRDWSLTGWDFYEGQSIKFLETRCPVLSLIYLFFVINSFLFLFFSTHNITSKI